MPVMNNEDLSSVLTSIADATIEVDPEITNQVGLAQEKFANQGPRNVLAVATHRLRSHGKHELAAELYRLTQESA